MAQSDLDTAVREEIEELHRFLMGWFTGALPGDDAVFEKEFLSRLDGDFVLIPPAGITLDRNSLGAGLKADHGNNPDFRIAIRNVQIRRETDNLVLATSKSRTHRVYLDRGVWADLTLVFERGEFRELPWTYPDYASEYYRQTLANIREIYKKQLRQTGCKEPHTA